MHLQLLMLVLCHDRFSLLSAGSQEQGVEIFDLEVAINCIRKNCGDQIRPTVVLRGCSRMRGRTPANYNPVIS